MGGAAAQKGFEDLLQFIGGNARTTVLDLEMAISMR
jgi:hypothetical protein